MACSGRATATLDRSCNGKPTCCAAGNAKDTGAMTSTLPAHRYLPWGGRYHARPPQRAHRHRPARRHHRSHGQPAAIAMTAATTSESLDMRLCRAPACRESRGGSVPGPDATSMSAHARATLHPERIHPPTGGRGMDTALSAVATTAQLGKLFHAGCPFGWVNASCATVRWVAVSTRLVRRTGRPRKRHGSGGINRELGSGLPV